MVRDCRCGHGVVHVARCWLRLHCARHGCRYVHRRYGYRCDCGQGGRYGCDRSVRHDLRCGFRCDCRARYHCRCGHRGCARYDCGYGHGHCGCVRYGCAHCGRYCFLRGLFSAQVFLPAFLRHQTVQTGRCQFCSTGLCWLLLRLLLQLVQRQERCERRL